jgi:colicin import membrane protein
MVVVSLLVHLTMFVILTRANFFPGIKYPEAPVYYVDVVNLPVASPQAGTPAAAPAPPAPVTPPRSAPREMTLPAPTPAKQKPAIAPAKVKPQKTAPETAREFEKRLTQLERESEARHEAEALDALKKRAEAGGRTPAGMPGATGKEAGSDYASYIQSRLRDAFKTTIASQSKNPEVVVRLTIDRTGRLVRSRLERSSGDKVFEDSVMRAIAKAEQTFPPPPRGGEFEQGFIFKPQGVVKK